MIPDDHDKIFLPPALAVLIGLLLAGMVAPSILYAQRQITTFESLTNDDGLSASYVTCLLQDRKGFIWIGTQDGLNRYDGYGFRIFRSIPGDSLSLTNSSITTLYQDQQDRIWVGTHGRGVNYYDPDLEQFVSFRAGQRHPITIPEGFVRAVEEDDGGNIWIGMDSGLIRLTPDLTGQSVIASDPGDPNSIPGNSVWGIARSMEDRGLWIGTDGGICLLDPENLTATRFPDQPDHIEILDPTTPPVMIEVQPGVLWVGTSNGLKVFDPFYRYNADGLEVPGIPGQVDNIVTSFHRGVGNEIWIGTDHGFHLASTDHGLSDTFVNNPADQRSLLSNSTTALLRDQSGSLWVGSDTGVSRTNPGSRNVRSFAKDPYVEANGLIDDHVWSIFEDRRGRLWFGTDVGIDCYQPGFGYLHHFVYDPGDPTGLSHNIVMSIRETREGGLLAGTRGGGLNRFDQESGTFTHYRTDPDDPTSISSDYVYVIHEDAGGIIWLATGNGLNRFDPVDERFSAFHIPAEDRPENLTGTDIWALIEDREGAFWVGIWGGGLYRFDRDTGRFFHIRNTLPDSELELGTNILSLFEDSSGIIWIGALDGLHRFDSRSGEFTRYSTGDGLPNDVIYGILEDDAGDLWLSTNRGISRFNSDAGNFTNFDTYDGLSSLEFNRGGFFRTRSGELFFGGINGVSSFFPEAMIQDRIAPEIVISEFNLFNEPVPIGQGPDGRTILERSITETGEISLSYRDTNISFGLTALEYIDTELIDYSYWMEGVDEGWNEVGDRRYASYFNLRPGEYTFHASARGRDRNRSEVVSLGITIKPPFTATPWFRAIVVLFLIAAVVGVSQYRTAAVRGRNIMLEQNVMERTTELNVANQNLRDEVEIRRNTERELQVQIDERLRLESQIQQARKLESLGSLAGGIAHDFNNLLTGVLGYTELALMNLPEDHAVRVNLEQIHTSAERAAELSLQMLAYSGKALFSFEILDISTVIGEMVRELERSLPGTLELKASLSGDLPSIKADRSQIIEAVSNVVENSVEAIGEEQGSISIVTGIGSFGRGYLSASFLDEELPEGDYVYVDILDTGSGMDQDAIERAFDPFFSTKFTGRGLGLAATLGIVRGHRGALRIESEVGTGTRIRLLLPVTGDIVSSE